MDDYPSARPNSEEGASQSAQACKAYVLSRFPPHITASWGAQSHHAVVLRRFVFHGVSSPGTSVVPTTCTSSVTLWVVCYCVSRGNTQNWLTHALRAPQKSSLGDRPI